MFTPLVSVTDDELYSLLTAALEGGSNYWYMITDKKDGGEKNGELSGQWEYAGAYPFRGGYLMIDDSNADEPILKTPVKLDRARLEKGLQKMADGWKNHFADLISGNDDGTTADVFLQCCVLDDCIYG